MGQAGCLACADGDFASDMTRGPNLRGGERTFKPGEMYEDSSFKANLASLKPDDNVTPYRALKKGETDQFEILVWKRPKNVWNTRDIYVFD